MGTVEMALLLKYGIPLAVKLLSNGVDEKETTKAVTVAIAGIASGEVNDIGPVFEEANEEQTKNIIDGLFGVITGATNALGGLVKALFRLFDGNS